MLLLVSSVFMPKGWTIAGRLERAVGVASEFMLSTCRVTAHTHVLAQQRSAAVVDGMHASNARHAILFDIGLGHCMNWLDNWAGWLVK